MKAIALDGASRSSAMLLRLLCKRARPDAALPRGAARRGAGRRVAARTGALVIGDAGFARRRRASRTSSISARPGATLTGLPFVYAVLGRAARRRRPDDVALLQREPGAGPGRRADDRARLAEAHGGDPGRLRALPARTTSATSWAPRSCRACRRFFDRARARRRCSRAPVRPRLFEAPRAHRGRAARGAAVAVHRRPARRRRRRRAPVARRRAPPLRRRAGAGAGRRRRRAPPGAAPRRRWSPTSSTATSTTRTSASPAASSATSTGRPRNKTEGYVLSREELDAEVPGDGRPGRRADPAAGRPQPEAAARLVRGSVPLDEGELPARHPRPVARGDPLHRRDREHVDPRR